MDKKGLRKKCLRYIISYIDTLKGDAEIYGVLEKNHIGRDVSRAQFNIFQGSPYISALPL